MSEIKEQIVERLREGREIASALSMLQALQEADESGAVFNDPVREKAGLYKSAIKSLATDAAARIKVLEEALRPFAQTAEEYGDEEDDEHQVWKDFDVLGASFPLRIFRRARLALNATPQDGKGGEEW